MDTELILMQDDGECQKCGKGIVKGQMAYQDRFAQTIFCSEFHWSKYYGMGESDDVSTDNNNTDGE